MTHTGQKGFFVDHDGVRLLGTYFMAAGDGPKPTVMLLHGIPGIEKKYDIALYLRERGWNAVIFHHRGCWGSSGSYNVNKIPEDTIAVLDHLLSGEFKEIDPGRFYVVGHSLGGWAAVLAAAKDQRICAVGLIGAVGDNDLFPLADPVYASDFTPWLSGITPDEFSNQWANLRNAFTPLSQVHHISDRPLLIVHSECDEVLPISHAEQLSEAAGVNCEIVIHNKANHSFTWHRPWLRATLFTWLNKTAIKLNNSKS